MIAWIVWGPRTKHEQKDFQSMILSLAGVIHNSMGSRVRQGAKSIMLETRAAVQSFIDILDGSMRNWITGNETKAVSLVIPTDKSSDDGISKCICTSFDLNKYPK